MASTAYSVQTKKFFLDQPQQKFLKKIKKIELIMKYKKVHMMKY